MFINECKFINFSAFPTMVFSAREHLSQDVCNYMVRSRSERSVSILYRHEDVWYDLPKLGIGLFVVFF